MDGDTSQDMRYAPPRAQVADVDAAEGPLAPATRMQRFWAAMIDLVIALTATWLATLVTPWNPWARVDPSYWQPGLLNPLVGFVLFLALHGVLLARRGQTIGKFLLGLRIVRPGGEQASFARLMLRYGVGYASTIVLAVGQVYGLIDALLIFRASRRCLHDQIADTLVVKA
jgi:uncharacterized RDD family membrane protein YckC